MSELGNIGGSLGNSHYFWIVTGKLSSDVLMKIYPCYRQVILCPRHVFSKYYVIVSRGKKRNDNHEKRKYNDTAIWRQYAGRVQA